MTVDSVLRLDEKHPVGTLHMSGGSARITFVPGDEGNDVNHKVANRIWDVYAQLMS